jgi:hypothetical protein
MENITMIKTVLTIFDKVQTIELERTTSGYDLWIWHLDGDGKRELNHIEIDGDNIEVQTTDRRPAKPRAMFAKDTVARCKELLSSGGKFTVPQLSTFLGLKKSSVHSLIWEMRKVHELDVKSEKTGERNKRFSI